jgi:CubicO group peptidase (beta-lactamase class C family)
VSLLPTTARRLDVLLAQEQVSGRLPSVVAGVVRDGSLEWTGSVGVLPDPQPGPDVQYRIGSITKTLTAVLVLQLRDEGALDLNDPLSRHLPRIAHGDRTLRDLLAHASGMHSEPRGSWWERSPGVSFEALADALPESSAFPPGATFHYTNTAYALLGEVVARHRGGPWWEQVVSRILTPLGMTRTSYLPEPPHATGWSVHHFANTLTPEPAYDAVAMAPAGQVWSTVTDLARYAAFLLEGHDQVLSRATLEEMAVPQAASKVGAMTAAHGLGLQLLHGGSGMVSGHTGSMPGFLAGLFVDPARRTGAVVLANATTGLRCGPFPVELLEALEECEGTVPPPWTPAGDVPPMVAELLGLWHWGNTAYAFSWNGTELVVTGLGRGGRMHQFALRADGTLVGTLGYHHGERLDVVRRGDGSISHLLCETFVYTRTPYDEDAPVPGR